MSVPTITRHEDGIITIDWGTPDNKPGPELVHIVPELIVNMIDAHNEYVRTWTIGPPKPQSNLVDHARRELNLIGEEQETIDGYLKIVQAFADMNHSGGSASVAIPVINELLQFHNLKALTDDPAEWMFHGSDVAGGDGIWQNIRRSEAFSHDGGKTYYLLSENRDSGDPKVWYDSEPKQVTDGE